LLIWALSIIKRLSPALTGFWMHGKGTALTDRACFFALNSLKKAYMIKINNAIGRIGLYGCAGLIRFKE
jgi:hypothetical protein